MEAGYDIVEDISCVDPSGKKMVLIRYPKVIGENAFEIEFKR